ncbi:MAG TPA: MBL fold metallo-hydrolase [Candidatus Saccharimonadales bacterium]|nr:MBL fold metallo-hydrolase [Candidatus Saccharimonadales bacterium]
MKLTKYQHACVVLEEQGQRLVIDPGNWTQLDEITDVVAIVITHVHADHCSPEHVAQLVATNSGVQIFGTQQVAEALAGQQVTVAQPGQSMQVGPFTLAFYGGQHAVVRPQMPTDQNVGVLVNGIFYYPGDSFVAPDIPVQLLALPVSAPWLKLSEVADFLAAVKPQACFPTHNAILSDTGQSLADTQVGGVCQELGVTYVSLKPGESTDI